VDRARVPSRALEEKLYELGRHVYVLDGDNIRHTLNGDLEFTSKDRQENVRRLGEVAALFVDSGIIVLTSVISPFRADRDRARNRIGPDRFCEVFIDAPLELCEQRDPKGLYKLARSGNIADFTGIFSPYEPPGNPEIVIPTSDVSIAEAVELLLQMLRDRGAFEAPEPRADARKQEPEPKPGSRPENR